MYLTGVLRAQLGGAGLVNVVKLVVWCGSARLIVWKLGVGPQVNFRDLTPVRLAHLRWVTSGHGRTDLDQGGIGQFRVTQGSRSDLSGTSPRVRDVHAHALLCGPLHATPRHATEARKRERERDFTLWCGVAWRAGQGVPDSGPQARGTGGCVHQDAPASHVSAALNEGEHTSAHKRRREEMPHATHHPPACSHLRRSTRRRPQDRGSRRNPPSFAQRRRWMSTMKKNLFARRCSLVEDGLQKPAGSPVCLSVYVRDMVTSLLTFSLASAYGSGLRAG